MISYLWLPKMTESTARLRPCHRHIVLELRHVALEHLFRLGEGAGVLGFPDGAGCLYDPVERAAAPRPFRTCNAATDVAHPLTRKSFKPLQIERFRPAARA